MIPGVRCEFLFAKDAKRHIFDDFRESALSRSISAGTTENSGQVQLGEKTERQGSLLFLGYMGLFSDTYRKNGNQNADVTV